MNVTYLHHSGFLVETKKNVMLFDYYTEGGKLDQLMPSDYAPKPFYVFVSHAHEDHFDTRILRWAEQKQVHYILSDDVKLPADFKGNVTYIKPHQSLIVGDLQIRTLASNDEGVAFLVQSGHRLIFHAGDLNWWHWKGESDTFNEDIKKSYCTEIDSLQGETIDAAFIPADPRLEEYYDLAVNYFMEQIGAKVLFPMHFWRKYDVCTKLRQKPYGAHVAHIKAEGEAFSV